jgi:hypothetical protein
MHIVGVKATLSVVALNDQTNAVASAIRQPERPHHRLWARSDKFSASYIVCAMFTKNYEHKAERLRASLDEIHLDYAIYEVPAVHRSINKNGIDDALLSKPQLISFALDEFNKPVLYVDADVCFRSKPLLFASSRADFAIYNWLADDSTDAWVPVAGQNIAPGNPPRYWNFSHAVDDWSETQLICSGCVQWWAPTNPARALLERWYSIIVAHPRAQDDHCLDAAFNYRSPDNLRFGWLPKEYARIAFWIFSDPVIDHPELPAPASDDFDTISGGRAIVSQITLDAGKRIPVARTMIIDTYNDAMLAPNMAGGYSSIGQLQLRLFL